MVGRRARTAHKPSTENLSPAERVARPGPGSRAEWAGLARMARARLHAGQPLTDLDLEAIRRHPDDD